MPNDFLHPNEIKRFIELYNKYAEQGYENPLKEEVIEFQTLIQKIDYENNPFTDDFKLVQDGNNYEEKFTKGINGHFGNNTVTAANAAMKWLSQAIENGAIDTKIYSEEELSTYAFTAFGKEYHYADDSFLPEAFRWQKGYDYNKSVVNLNKLVERSHFSEDQYGWITQYRDLPDKTNQKLSRISPFDMESTFGKEYFKVYTNAIDDFKNDREVQAILSKDNWTENDRDLWEQKLSESIIKHFAYNDLFHGNVRGDDGKPLEKKTNLNNLDINDFFSCNEQAISSGTIMQIIENQLLGGCTDHYKCPVEYYKISLEHIDGEYQYGGSHTVVISPKTGNITSNGKQFIYNSNSFKDFIDGVPIILDDDTFYVNDGRLGIEPLDKALTTIEQDLTKQDEKAGELYNEFKNNRQDFDNKRKSILKEAKEERDRFIKEKIESNTSKEWVVSRWDRMSAGELKSLVEDLKEKLIDIDIKIINNKGIDNDRILVNGSTYNAKFANDKINNNDVKR